MNTKEVTHLEAYGNAWNIKRDHRKTQINVRNDGDDIDRGTIKRIRSELRLMPADGYPSFVFYQKGERDPEFIYKYENLLNKLAKN